MQHLASNCLLARRCRHWVWGAITPRRQRAARVHEQHGSTPRLCIEGHAAVAVLGLSKSQALQVAAQTVANVD